MVLEGLGSWNREHQTDGRMERNRGINQRQEEKRKVVGSVENGEKGRDRRGEDWRGEIKERKGEMRRRGS